MHLKNFSLIIEDETWNLSPAYDLLNVHIVLPEDPEELALTIDGKKRKFTRQHFIEFGLKVDLTEKQILGVFNRFRKKKENAMKLINISFLSPEMRSKYTDLLESRYERLEIEK